MRIRKQIHFMNVLLILDKVHKDGLHKQNRTIFQALKKNKDTLIGHSFQ
jgi:hypothetical protein